MNHNSILARLSMVSGELVPLDEVLSNIAMFGYALADRDLRKFSYKNDDQGISDIRILREGALIELWGTHEEDAFTLQALAKKLGWEVADIDIFDKSIEGHLLRNFTVLKLREVRYGGQGSEHEEDHIETGVVAEAGTAIAPVFPTAENNSAEADGLRAENLRLNETIAVLQREKQEQAMQSGHAPARTDARTLTLIGVLVDSLIDLSGNPVVKQLAAHGFNVRVVVE